MTSSATVGGSRPGGDALLLPEPGAVRGRQNLDTLIPEWPWTQRDIQSVVSRLAVGLAVIVGSWVGASKTALWNQQLIWIGVGLAGLLISGLSLVGWLLNGLATISAERTVVRRAVLRRRESQLASRGLSGNVDDDTFSTVRTEVRGEPLASGTLVAGEGMTHFHRPDCQAVLGKPVEELSFAECMRREMSPCGMCKP